LLIFNEFVVGDKMDPYPKLITDPDGVNYTVCIVSKERGKMGKKRAKLISIIFVRSKYSRISGGCKYHFFVGGGGS
jgi:hypothetical protein